MVHNNNIPFPSMVFILLWLTTHFNDKHFSAISVGLTMELKRISMNNKIESTLNPILLVIIYYEFVYKKL